MNNSDSNSRDRRELCSGLSARSEACSDVVVVASDIRFYHHHYSSTPSRRRVGTLRTLHSIRRGRETCITNYYLIYFINTNINNNTRNNNHYRRRRRRAVVRSDNRGRSDFGISNARDGRKNVRAVLRSKPGPYNRSGC